MSGGFSATERDLDRFRRLHLRWDSTSPDEVRELLRMSSLRRLNTALALARRCTDDNVAIVVREGLETALHPVGIHALNIDNAETFFRLIAQRMTPRVDPGRRDVAELTTLGAGHLADVLDAQAQVVQLHTARHRLRRDGLNPTLAVSAVRDRLLTSDDVFAHSAAIWMLPPAAINAALSAAALRATDAAQTGALLDVADRLSHLPGWTPALLRARLAGLLQLRQQGRLFGVDPLPVAALDGAMQARLNALLDGPAEVVSYERGGPGLPPPIHDLTDSEAATLLGYADRATGNVGGQVLMPKAATLLLRRWIGDSALELRTMGHEVVSADGRHHARFSMGKAVSGGVPTLNLERWEPVKGTRLRRVANVHVTVIVPQIEGPALSLAA